MVEKGASKEKIGVRGPMPPGMLFAIYDSETGVPEYIPTEYIDIPQLLDELVEYVNTTDDHPLIVAAVVHYQLVTKNFLLIIDKNLDTLYIIKGNLGVWYLNFCC